uniref:Uncharacterized protein n=1 Tax=Timema poppense TaxID=170557 RepID=A0A7R9HF97_TIMPO|nr:unnamed protein product [Timema poppensis]
MIFYGLSPEASTALDPALGVGVGRVKGPVWPPSTTPIPGRANDASRRSQIGASYLETNLSTESSTGIITVETWPTSKDYGVREREFVGVRGTGPVVLAEVSRSEIALGGNNMSSAKGRIRVETEPLNPETALVAERELRETPERIKEATVALRELLRGNKTKAQR